MSTVEPVSVIINSGVQEGSWSKGGTKKAWKGQRFIQFNLRTSTCMWSLYIETVSILLESL